MRDGFSIGERETKLSFDDRSRNLEESEPRSLTAVVGGAATFTSLANHGIREMEQTLLVLQITIDRGIPWLATMSFIVDYGSGSVGEGLCE